MVQWLRRHLPVEGVWVGPLVNELRFYMLRGQRNQNVKQKPYSKNAESIKQKQ